MPASAYVEIETLKAWLEGKALTLPTKLWVALLEEEATRDATSETIKEAGKGKELSYTGYARKEVKIEAGPFDFTEGTSGAISKAVNKAAIEMSLNSGADANDAAKNWAMLDKAKNTEAGKLFFYGKLTAELKVQPTLTKVEFEAKKLEITLE